MKNKFFNIFKPGTHIDAAGQEISFSEDDLKDIAASYNSEVHEAPICCGHPKHDKPAFGWIKQLCYDAGSKMLRAMPAQVNPEFAEMVNSGAFKKISPAFYSPSSPANPNPGHFTLRRRPLKGWAASALPKATMPMFPLSLILPKPSWPTTTKASPACSAISKTS